MTQVSVVVLFINVFYFLPRYIVSSGDTQQTRCTGNLLYSKYQLEHVYRCA